MAVITKNRVQRAFHQFSHALRTYRNGPYMVGVERELDKKFRNGK